MKIKCKVCGKRFKPNKENVCLATEQVSFMQTLTTVAKTYEVIDCPRCGCQNLLNIRMPIAAEREEEHENESET